jgi:hypothetical protein
MDIPLQNYLTFICTVHCLGRISCYGSFVSLKHILLSMDIPAQIFMLEENWALYSSVWICLMKDF